MNIIKRTTVLSIEANADDWALYHQPKRELVAKALNIGMKRIINTPDQTYAQLCAAISALLGKYRDWGAADTEGWSMVRAIIRDVHNREVL